MTREERLKAELSTLENMLSRRMKAIEGIQARVTELKEALNINVKTKQHGRRKSEPSGEGDRIEG